MSEVYTQSDSTEGITGLTALRMLRLTHQGQHRTRGGVHDWYCLFRFVKFTIRLDENSVQTFSPRGHTHTHLIITVAVCRTSQTVAR